MKTNHLTDAEAAAIADGEAAPAEAIQHLSGCESCSERVADLALRSIEVHRVVVQLEAPERVFVPKRSGATVPLMIGLLVAIAASVPLLPSASHLVSAVFAGRGAHLDALASLGRTLLSSTRDPAWSLGSTAVLIVAAAAAALVVSRHASRSSSNEGVNRS